MLAPMYRAADAAFRAQCHQAGADLSFYVMLARSGEARKGAPVPQVFPELDGVPQPQMRTGVQLIGSDPQTMADEARFLESCFGEGLAVIDINMGCPIVHVTRLGAGAVLMEDLPRAQAIIEAVVAGVALPVSVKFRKGPRAGQEIAPEFGRMAEGCGATAITVHGRTTDQFFDGLADKAVIERVKAKVGIPVYASGDIRTAADVRTYRGLGADGVMVARAAREDPQVFRELQKA